MLFLVNKKLILSLKILKIVLILNVYILLLVKQKILSKNNSKFLKYLECDDIFLGITDLNYKFSFKYNITKIEYIIGFYNKKKKIIIPSHLTLYKNLHIFCQTYFVNNKIYVKYIANIYNNIYYKCIEYLNINEQLKFGIAIYKKYKYMEIITLELFTNELINYNNYIFKNNEEFEPLINMNIFAKIIKFKKSLLFRKLYYRKPSFIIKYQSELKESKWYFKNIYNNYFCYCIYSINTKCLFKNIYKKFKYELYLNIIDNQRYLYNKTKYLLADFASIDTSPGEAYLIFEEMRKQNLSAHFMSKREDIINKYNNLTDFEINLDTPIILKDYYIDGDFIEKYLDLFLKLKIVVSGAKIYSFNNLFYNIEYITYICLGHGVAYLKDFLYKDYYSNKIYNKILLPPSDIIISNAKKYGWTDEKIIKIGLPRWDIFSEYEKKTLLKKEIINEQSIFIMFTWRNLKSNQTISKYYFKNILDLIYNQQLNQILKKKKISLYFTLHHMIEKYKHIFNINKSIKYIKQEKIIECLKNSSLIITDFSSIIFDIMVRKKPFIIFIPDSEDKNLFYIYDINYYNVINDLKSGAINFENRFFNVKDTVNKIIFYIHNNFNLDDKLKKFYELFKLLGGNNTKKFILYMQKLK